MRLWPYLIAAAVLVVVLFGVGYFVRAHPGNEREGLTSATAWQRMAEPGPLSRAHASLEHNCASCHTPIKGVEARSCIPCHANNRSLLERQPTAFHANINSCVECHREHENEPRPTRMDHAALVRIESKRRGEKGPAQPLTEAALNCSACHSSEDRHRGLFGTDCMQCHATTTWTIPQFRHPSPTSTSCAQCHQAPPSHYMEHFQMVSMTVARQEHAQVSQCYLCHQTNNWNDIKGTGWYKHH